MNLNKLFLCFIGVILNFSDVLSLNILGVFPYQGKSHFFVFEPYLKELARRGHNLTVLSYFPQKTPIENYHDISIKSQTKVLEGIIPVHRSYWSLMQINLLLSQMGRENCQDLLADKNVQNLWKTKAKFDVVVVEQFNNDCALGLAYKLGAPVVGMTSHVLMPWHYNRLGIQFHPAYMPMQFAEGGINSSLYQRVEKTIMQGFVNLLFKYRCQIPNEYELQKYFDDMPPIEQLARDVKFVLLYTNFVVTGPSLYPPNVIEVGGYHVAAPKELPKDLNKFIEESEHGVIYISFGSMLQSASMPKDKIEAIVAAISELPQRVIWKWDDDSLPGHPKNVYLSKWLPQNDILVEDSGLGVQIQIRDLTKENLLEKIRTVLDPEFRRHVKELSKVWHDRPLSAMDTAIYWTEFAARTINFTFRSPASTVPMYQYLYLDVIIVLLPILVGSVIVLYYCLIFLLSLCRGQKTQKIKTK